MSMGLKSCSIKML